MVLLSSIVILVIVRHGSGHMQQDVMETETMDNELAALDIVFQQPMEEHNTKDDEHSKPTDEMIVDAGYPAETHDIVTDDGYILRLHRIPPAYQQQTGSVPAAWSAIFLC